MARELLTVIVTVEIDLDIISALKQAGIDLASTDNLSELPLLKSKQTKVEQVRSLLLSLQIAPLLPNP